MELLSDSPTRGLVECHRSRTGLPEPGVSAQPGRQLWHNQPSTGTIEELVTKVSTLTFVAIDISNHENVSACDVGIAILPAFPDCFLDAPLDSSGVGALATEHGAFILNFCTPPEAQRPRLQFSRDRFSRDRTEKFLWGTEDTLPGEKIGPQLVAILQRAQQ